MTCEICDRIEHIKAGTHPLYITELRETFAVLGENQGCVGWCVLLLKEHAEHLGELEMDRQLRIFGDVSRMAGAIRRVFATTGAGGMPPRLNYECLGNVAAHVHWHIIPRHAHDPEPRAPVWGWSSERLRGTMDNAERQALAHTLREALR